MTVEIRRAPRDLKLVFEMLYQCDAPDKPLRKHLDWQWLAGDQSKGISEWVLEPS